MLNKLDHFLQFFFVVISFLCLILSFVVSDFSNETVFNNSHTTTNDRVFMTGTGLWHHEAQHDPRMFYFGGSYHGGHHAAGLRIETSTGNISDHDFAIFGIKAY